MRLRVLATVVPAAAALACASGSPAPGRAAAAPPPAATARTTEFANTSASLAAMCEELLEALANRDEARLRAISISRTEFEDIVWPANPNSGPPNNLPADFPWGLYEPKYERGLRNLLERHGGTRYGFRSIGFTGDREDFGSFVVHHESYLEVEDGDGQPRRLRLFGAVIEQGGRFKIYGYVTD